jgi:hypothetical protein
MKSIRLILLPFLVIASIFIYSNATLLFNIMALFISLAFAAHGIIQKHKGKPNAYKSVFQEIGVFIVTLLLVILFGGLAGAFVNFYVSSLYGAITGLVIGLITAFAMGYGVRSVTAKLIR